MEYDPVDWADGILNEKDATIRDLTRQLGEANKKLDRMSRIDNERQQHAADLISMRAKLAEAEEAVRLAAEHFYLAEDDDAGWSMGEPSPNLGAARELARRELVKCKAFSAAVARARGGEG